MFGMKEAFWSFAILVAFAGHAAACGSLTVEHDGKTGVSWICGADGAHVVGVGAVRMKQDGWNCDVSVTQRTDCVVARIVASGGRGCPDKWTLMMPLANGAEKEDFSFKPGRWRRHAAGREAEPEEVSLGRYRIVRSPAGGVLFTLPGSEHWSGPAYEAIELEDLGGGVFAREICFREIRRGETPEECVARAAGLPFSVTLGTPERNNIFPGGDATIRWTVAETAGRRAEGVPVSLVVRDWDGSVVFEHRATAALAPYGRKEGCAKVPSPGRGIFFVELAAGEGAEEEFARTTFAVIPPFKFKGGGGFFFGLNLRTGGMFRNEVEAEYALAARLGFRYLRDGDHALARKFGMRSGFLCAMPKHDYDPGSAEDAATIEGWLNEIARMDSPMLEFGNEIGHFADEAERHVLYDRYNGWLDAIRIGRERRGMRFKIAYGTSSRRPELMRLIEEKGIFKKLDLFVVHPGRLNWTPDAIGSGWRYRGLVVGSKRIYADFGCAATPIVLTEVYAKTQPNDPHGDSLRQSAESAVLNAVIAKADGMAGFCAYQLHDGVSWDENGFPSENGTTRKSEWYYGMLNRDNSPKPSALGYETAAEELDGSRFVREVRLKGTALNGFLFDTPRGHLAVLWDRTEGFDLRTQGPRKRTREEKFFHFEPWLDNWREKTPYDFAAAGGVKSVEVRDVIGRKSVRPVEGGKVKLELTGSPVFVRGLNPSQFDAAEPPAAAACIDRKGVGEPEGIY